MWNNVMSIWNVYQLKDHHDIKQKHKFILPFVMPKPVSHSWMLSPSLYTNQMLKHVKYLVYPLGYIWLHSVFLLFEIIFHQLDLVENFVTLWSHFSAIILPEYLASTLSVNFTVYGIVFRMSVSFTIIMSF